MQERIDTIKAEIIEIQKWFEANNTQQFYSPLGIITKKMVNDSLIVSELGALSAVTYDITLEVDVNGTLYWLPAKLN